MRELPASVPVLALSSKAIMMPIVGFSARNIGVEMHNNAHPHTPPRGVPTKRTQNGVRVSKAKVPTDAYLHKVRAIVFSDLKSKNISERAMHSLRSV